MRSQPDRDRPGRDPQDPGPKGIYLFLAAFLAAPLASPLPADQRPTANIECRFTEPFFRLTLSSRGLHYRGDDGLWKRTNGALMSGEPRTVLHATFHIPSEGAMTLVVTPGEGSDGMNLTLTDLAGEFHGWGIHPHLEGACFELPAGLEPRRVRGLSSEDRLNVRLGKSASTPAIAQLDEGEIVWTKPDGGRWIEVLFARDWGEEEALDLARGFVNASFTSPL